MWDYSLFDKMNSFIVLRLTSQPLASFFFFFSFSGSSLNHSTNSSCIAVKGIIQEISKTTASAIPELLQDAPKVELRLASLRWL